MAEMTGKSLEQRRTEEVMEAAKSGELKTMCRLIEYSAADMTAHDQDYNNILYYGVQSDSREIVQYLVERVGLNPLEANRFGRTPWDLAQDAQKEEVLDYFKNHFGYSYEETYHNPIRRGFFPDPSIVRVGEDYYMVNSTFVFFPCIPISHSKDLIHWEIIGHAVANPEYAKNLGNLNGGMGYWAPDISYCDGRFYIAVTLRCNDDMEKRRVQMVTSSERPEGPYDEPVYLDEEGIDPSIFHDDDGRKYMVLNKGARIVELSKDCKQIISPAKMLWYGDNKRKSEGPHMLKYNGYYYLFLAEGGTGMGHCITVARSKIMMGPYEPSPYSPILHQWKPGALIQCCGHGKPVQLSDGRWAIVYLCLRMLDGKYGMMGRETAIDPLTWTSDGWPVINGGRGPSDQQKLLLPLCRPQPFRESLGGYPNWKNREWMTPRPLPFERLEVKDGILRLTGQKEDLNRKACRSIFVTRQESFRFEAYCEFLVPEMGQQESLGMVCYYDENSYIKYGICQKDGEYAILFQEYVEDSYRSEIIRRLEPDDLRPGMKVRCRVVTRDLERRFFCEYDGRQIEGAAVSDTSYLSSEGLKKGKRFTGAVLGVYVHGDFRGEFTDWQIIQQDS